MYYLTHLRVNLELQMDRNDPERPKKVLQQHQRGGYSGPNAVNKGNKQGSRVNREYRHGSNVYCGGF